MGDTCFVDLDDLSKLRPCCIWFICFGWARFSPRWRVTFLCVAKEK